MSLKLLVQLFLRDKFLLFVKTPINFLLVFLQKNARRAGLSQKKVKKKNLPRKILEEKADKTKITDYELKHSPVSMFKWPLDQS